MGDSEIKVRRRAARVAWGMVAQLALGVASLPACAPPAKSSPVERSAAPAPPPSWSACFPSTTLELGGGRLDAACLALLDEAPPGAFEHVILRDGTAADVARVARLGGVRWLEIHDGAIDDLSPLARLGELERETLAGIELGELGFLASLPRLRQLELGPVDYEEHNSGVLCPAAPPTFAWPLTKALPLCADLSQLLASLPALEQLEELTVSATAGPITAGAVDVAPIAKLTALERLEIHAHHGWLSLRGIQRSPVVDLTVVGASLVSVAPLRGKQPPLRRLSLIGLCQTPTRDFTAGSDEAPEMCWSPFSGVILPFRVSLSKLAALPELTYLDLSGTSSSVDLFLPALVNLEFLGLQRSGNDWSALLAPTRPCVVDISYAYNQAELSDRCDCKDSQDEDGACGDDWVYVRDVLRAYQSCPSRCTRGCGVLHTCPREPPDRSKLRDEMLERPTESPSSPAGSGRTP